MAFLFGCMSSAAPPFYSQRKKRTARSVQSAAAPNMTQTGSRTLPVRMPTALHGEIQMIDHGFPRIRFRQTRCKDRFAHPGSLLTARSSI